LAASKAETKGERAFSGETEQATVLAPVQSWPAIEKIPIGWRLVIGHEYLQFVSESILPDLENDLKHMRHHFGLTLASLVGVADLAVV